LRASLTASHQQTGAIVAQTTIEIDQILVDVGQEVRLEIAPGENGAGADERLDEPPRRRQQRQDLREQATLAAGPLQEWRSGSALRWL